MVELLEKLKELSATTGRRNGNEDLGHWADREKHENAWVRDIALPALIAVAEADIAMDEIGFALDNLTPGGELYAEMRKSYEHHRAERAAALAKLEVEA